ncbi:MAG TPA: SPFH domain-containing protein [Pseudonocardia sp.]|nr:SPFH domain-containing protein [Pseudonocardia sp.]
MGSDGTTAGAGAAAPLPVSGTQAATLVALAVVLLALCSVRSVPVDERIVVLRPGRRARLRGPGVVAVVPGLDRGVRVPLRERWYDVTRLDATTRDAVRVTVTATATGTLRDPLQYVLSGRPDAAVEWVLEAELRRCLAERDLGQLATVPATGLPGLAPAASARTAAWGVEITDVQVARIEAGVDAGLVRWASGLR